MADLEDFYYDQKATELAEKLVRTLQQDRDDLGNEARANLSREPNRRNIHHPKDTAKIALQLGC